MEFISKNLGLDSVELRDDYTFESKPFRLENGSLYNILTFSDSYITRLLIFEKNDKKSNGYIGNIDMRQIRQEVMDYGLTLRLKSLDYPDSIQGRLLANYNLSKMYLMKLPISDEYGYVTVTADKQVEFMWDEEKKCFVSKYSFDDLSIDDFISDFQEIKDKCSKLLDKYYNQLESNITAASSKSDDTARAYKAFLDDCIPDKKVDNLKRKLVYNR